MDCYDMEKDAWSRGVTLVCGVDEAGRGPLAGPVAAAAVILNPRDPIRGIDDSKKLSPKKREELFGEIQSRSLAWAIAFVGEKEIDEINILQASMKAMAQAVGRLSLAPQLILVDGNRRPPVQGQVELLVKGDARSASIGAASILAKVARDRYMEHLDRLYPAYGFAKHKGYPTKAHYEAIRAHGVLPVHRKTFLKNMRGE